MMLKFNKSTSDVRGTILFCSYGKLMVNFVHTKKGFSRGGHYHKFKSDHILVKDHNNIECARGLASFSSIEIEKIKGSHSSKIKNILGYSSRDEIIHKDDLVKV